MSGVDKIRESEARVAELQSTLDSVQDGLQKAETVAIAAEDARRERTPILVAAAATATVAVVLVVWRRRRKT